MLQHLIRPKDVPKGLRRLGDDRGVGDDIDDALTPLRYGMLQSPHHRGNRLAGTCGERERVDLSLSRAPMVATLVEEGCSRLIDPPLTVEVRHILL